MTKKHYDTTVARIAGNLLSGANLPFGTAYDRFSREELASRAVALARAIVEETKRTEPEVPTEKTP